MPIKIIEIKAQSSAHKEVRNLLLENKAVFKGEDHQIDTYFKVNEGRLKLREGNIENHLIQYNRENKSGPKQSNVKLYNTNPDSSLKDILVHSLGILAVVDKKREIYFIENIKFHIDTVKELGTFIEIEAIDRNDDFSSDELLKQCEYYMELFKIDKKDLISVSYSDLLLEMK